MNQSASSRLHTDRHLLSAVGGHEAVLFLDIETTGLSRYYDEITLVGFQAGGHYSVHIRGEDPTCLLDALAASDTLVTFNGTSFDVPFLLQTFTGARLPTAHVDLRYTLRRLGLTGGQKPIEQELGVDLRAGLEDIDGAEAVLLWHRYLRGDTKALKLLVRYNQADVEGMCHLLDHAVDRVKHRDFWIAPPRYGDLARMNRTDPFKHRDLPAPPARARIAASFQDLFGSRRSSRATAVGIDLTGSETKPSGYCALRGHEAETRRIGSDDALVEAVLQADPDVVSIDSPLCLPRGRLHVGDDDPGRSTFGIMRMSERTLKRRGINVYPCLLPSMQRLTERGIRLANRLRHLGYPVIESYPGAAQDIMGIPRKGAGVQWLQMGLAEFGITGDFVANLPSHDELDAITSALVGIFLLDGAFEALGGEEETALIVPDLNSNSLPLVIGLSGRIAAGKTTAARWIEADGFAYTRFSLVIDDEIRRRGLNLDRPTRQRIGMEIHKERGQAWLCEQALARVGGADRIVVDGLRWPEDRAFFVERFGHRFVQFHVTASATIRMQRSIESGAMQINADFERADAQPVESMIDTLGRFTASTIANEATLEQFRHEVSRVVKRAGLEVR